MNHQFSKFSGRGLAPPPGIAISPECEQFIGQWLPFVRFQLPSELKEEQFRHWLHDLLLEFIQAADRRNEKTAEHCLDYGQEWAEEGGIGIFYVDGVYIDHIKLHLYRDETPRFRDWSGLVFHEHAYKGLPAVAKIYLVTDAFERFLKERGVTYERYGLKNCPREEVLQSQSS